MRVGINAEKLLDEYTQYILDAFRGRLVVNDELQNFRQALGRHARKHAHDLENMRVVTNSVQLLSMALTVPFDFYPRSDQLQQIYKSLRVQLPTHCTHTYPTAATARSVYTLQPPVDAASIPADVIKMLAMSLLSGTCVGCVGGGCNVRLSSFTGYCGFSQWQGRIRYVHQSCRRPDIEAVKSLRAVAKKFSRTISIEYILRQVDGLYGCRYRKSYDMSLVSLSYGPTQHQSWLIRANTSFATLDLAHEYARAYWERKCTMAAEWTEVAHWWESEYHRDDFTDWVFSMVAHVDKNPLIIYAPWFHPPAHDKIILSTQARTSRRWFNYKQWRWGYNDDRIWTDPFFAIEIRVINKRSGESDNATLRRLNRYMENMYSGMSSNRISAGGGLNDVPVLDFASLYPSLMHSIVPTEYLIPLQEKYHEATVKNMFAIERTYFEERPYITTYPTMSAGICSPIRGDVRARGSKIVQKPNRRERRVQQKTTKWQTTKVTKWQKVKPYGYGKRK